MGLLVYYYCTVIDVIGKDCISQFFHIFGKIFCTTVWS